LLSQTIAAGKAKNPVTTAYKENWKAIFSKKNAKKKKR
jgi:hypothetical protein